MGGAKAAGPTDTSQRLAALRELMNKDPKVDAYLIPSEDQHSSEYLAECDERRAFITGFTGSAGTALVLRESAMLFTDGRYFLQASQQLDHNWTLMKQGLPHVPTWQEYLSKNLVPKSRIGFDPTLISIDDAETLEKDLKPLESTLVPTANLVDKVWGTERPPRPSNDVFPLEEKYTGKSSKDKIARLREQIKKKTATATVVTQLDEVAWLFNLRGSDIPFNPVFFAYASVTLSKVTLFTNKERLNPKTIQALEADQIVIEPYDSIVHYLETNPLCSNSEKVLIGKKTSVAIVNVIGKDKVIIDRAPVADLKSIKTEAEIEGFRQCHIRDGAALARYFSWLEMQLQAGAKISESEGADKLEHYRKQLDLFMGLSFPTISSTGPNGAIIHYQPDPTDCATIQKDQIYLCDSGAQFKDGTTDTTRTWHFGEPTADEIRAFTRVLQGHINIDTAVIPPRTTGFIIDCLARKYLWEDGMDYRHGTGHGVGHFLNVHEGPQGIGKRLPYNDTYLKAGMTLSNEPGYYADGKFGIRIENIVVLRKVETLYRFGDVDYLGFEHITMSPMHRKLIDKSLLSPQELKWINLYHAEVLHKVGPSLQGKNEDDLRALAWLERECKPFFLELKNRPDVSVACGREVADMLVPFLAKKALRCQKPCLVTHYTLRYASTLSVELSDADRARLFRQRNIGVSAHIDSGKTTLTERILFYTGRINAIHEVRGRDNVGAKMDSMDLEREKGITIQSATTFCDWKTTNPISGDKEEYSINIIDTPGHVDFTIEVERALRVLDGAILVLCAVSGVQSQTITVDRQMRRYNVPRISFINKMDRPGANPARVIQQIRQKLRIPAAAVHVPIGVEDDLSGVVDLIRWKAIYNRGPKGIEVVEEEIPAALLPEAKARRAELIEQLAEVDEQMSDAFLEDIPITTELLVAAIRRATIARKFTPVFLGSAVKNTAVQPLLDGVCAYLPTPSDAATSALDLSKPAGEQAVDLTPAAEAPLVALAFKLEEGRYGQLTYMRVYQGSIKKGGWIWHAKTGKKVKVPRLVRMHSDDMEDIEAIGPGEICATFGIECASGDTFTDGQTSLSMTSMFVPDPVISLAIKPEGTETPNFSKALNRFKKEDPTFRVHVDSESQETIISGMGELHLEIYAERMKREYNVPCITGKPQVAFRETITAPSKFNYTHKKQTGGAGQFARVIGSIEPEARDPETGKDIVFENMVMSGNVPNNFIPAVEKGFLEAMEKGSLAGCPVNGVKYTLEDGAFHAVDSSELAFKVAAIGSFREAYKNASPVILEPIMTVEITAPVEFQGNIIGGVNQRRGTIIDTEVRDDEFTLIAEVSLNDMFGYSSALRGATQGKGEFSMEYKEHQPVMPHVQKEMADAYRKKLEGKSK